jgi:hypothetical protein
MGFADAQEKTHKKRSNVSKNKIVYSEKKYKPTFTKKKPPKKYMFAGENMHRDRFK